MKSIQTKLTVITLIIFLAAMGALGGLNYWKAQDIIFEDITSSMSKEAVNSADDIASWLKRYQSELLGITMAPAIQSGDPAEIVSFLASVKKESNRFEVLDYVMPDGTYFNSVGLTGDLSKRSYFQKALRGEAAVSDPLISKGTGNLVAMVAVPVKVNGKVTGVLAGGVNMEEVAKQVLAIKVGQTGYAYVQQGDGLVVIHPNPDIAMKTNDLVENSGFPAVYREVSERMAKGESGFIRYELGSIENMMAFAPVAGTNWSLALMVPTAEMTGALAVLTKVSLLTIVVVLIVTSLFITWFSRRIAKPIRDLEKAANRIAAGDISQTKLNIISSDEIGRLGQSFEQMTKNLHNLIQKILGATEQVAASSQELTASSDQSAQASNQIATAINIVAAGASEQMDAANDTTAVVEQISASIQQIAANANKVAAYSVQAAEKAKAGDRILEQAINQMGQIEETVNISAQVVTKLGKRSKEIGQIIDTISGIAGQTNLLALNAAIEAARAGEQGRGFAVVAEEVRKLAEQSQEAAQKIAELIGEIQGDTDRAVVAMDNGTREVEIGAADVNTAGTAFREIAGLVTEVSDQVQKISAAMHQMAIGSQQIVDSVKKIDDLGKKSTGEAQSVSAAAQEQLASMEEIASSSQELAKLAQNLQSEVNGFKI